MFDLGKIAQGFAAMVFAAALTVTAVAAAAGPAQGIGAATLGLA